MSDDGITDTGGLEDVAELLSALNELGSSGDRERVAAALASHGDDVTAILTELTDGPLPEHVSHYLIASSALLPVFVGVMRSFATGAAGTVEVKTTPEQEAPSLSVDLNDGNLVLTVRGLV